MKGSIQELTALLSYVNKQIEYWESSDSWDASENLRKLDDAKSKITDRIIVVSYSMGFDIRPK